jgi:hypothetical protein
MPEPPIDREPPVEREPPSDRQVIKQLYSNPTARNLLAIWYRVAGSRFPMKVVCDLLGVNEETIENKLQAMAGLGLANVSTDAKGERIVEFLISPNDEMVVSIEDFLDSRKGEFESVETKVRSLLYITLLNYPV